MKADVPPLLKLIQHKISYFKNTLISISDSENYFINHVKVECLKL